MKKKIYIYILALVGLFVSCVENDLPYPYIKGEVLSIEVRGATETKIDAIYQVVTVTLSDTVSLFDVTILSMEITADSRSTLNSGDVLDMSSGKGYNVGSPYSFTISTFQDYEWQFTVLQPINRAITTENSIGDALFDLDNYIAIVYVASSQALDDITIEECVLAPSVATYSPDPYSVRDFSRGVPVEVSFFGLTQTWTIYMQHAITNVITGDVNAWSTFAYLSGSVLATSTDDTGFEYKKVGDTAWNIVKVDQESGKINGVATGLTPNNSYVYRAFLGSEYGDEKSFNTMIEPEVPNLNFDDAVKDGVVWYFNSSGTNSYWATGNEGVSIMNKSNTTSVSGDEAYEGVGSAVMMETFDGVPFAQVAAGNLYTGTYETKIGSADVMATSATMGRPYVGRPTSMSGYYKYSPGIITESSYWSSAANIFGYNFADSVGKADWAQIYIRLEKWPSDATVRPDESLIEVIAYGSLETNQEMAQYTEFEIPLTYYDLETMPNSISIVATSSINGGYFCGAAGSVLYVDNFSLGFEYIE